ncbi:hypothetical protein BS78_01G154800 [Paspalum vaginatum]|nr:hypothetical protein BS78_01G154800 [Paspalum vaginatum]KAJ1294566.1 hypothetical protein BS78_01G154800 [Paspalum vaginatum]KAJ1294567.1 hypothetical protein BS78_01G154800 [Paspalum vaginatum]KAJ1294568.1 hypothetical protein BS78_01G154800 [Paspalum vaginatum]
MAKQVFEGVQMDASLNAEQRHEFSKKLSTVVWKIKVDDSTAKKDDGPAHVAGVCISPMGYILTSSHVIKPIVKYSGSCSSWKAGWTSLKVVKRSLSCGLCLLKVEKTGSKKVDHTDLAEMGVLRVNQHLYGFGHPEFVEMSCPYTFARGSLEFQCDDIMELPPCVNDLDNPSAELLEGQDMAVYASEIKFDMKKVLASSPRMVKHLKCIIDVKLFRPKTILLMHQDIPLIQIKNFHLGYCGDPVFVSSGHVVGIILFKFHDINFAVHLSAIKEFLKDIDLANVQPHVS